MDDQALKDVPRNDPKEYKRQKGPLPLAAILLPVGLIAVFLLYYMPAIVSSLFMN